MDAGGAKRKFIESAYLIDPLYLFEANYDAQALASSLIEKCEKIAGSDTEELYRWLERINEECATYCFYGSSLLLPDPSDVDMASISANPGPLFVRKPTFVHVLELHKVAGNISRDWGSFFFGPLLFPKPPPEFVLNIIDGCRDSAFASPFFGGGYGEPLTYAAFKAIGRENLFQPDEWEIVRSLKRFEIKYRYPDFTNMQTVSYSIQEVHDQIRKKMFQLDDKEVRALAMAATRKIGVKEQHRAAVAETFVRELKKMKR
jgi:hypothetical protein